MKLSIKNIIKTSTILVSIFTILSCTSKNSSFSMSAPNVNLKTYKYAAIYNARSGVTWTTLSPGASATVGGSKSSMVGASMVEQRIANVLSNLGFIIVGELEISEFDKGEVIGVRYSEELMERHKCAFTILLEDIKTGKTLLTVQGTGGEQVGFGYHASNYDCDEAFNQAVEELNLVLTN